MLPTKPIEKIYIHFAGDRSVGIWPQDFEMSCFIDLSSFENKQTALEVFRVDIRNVYEGIHGDPPSYVLFDFEYQSMVDSENQLHQDLEDKIKSELGVTRVSLG